MRSADASAIEVVVTELQRRIPPEESRVHRRLRELRRSGNVDTVGSRMNLGWIALPVTMMALGLAAACAEPERERAPVEVPTTQVARDVERIEFRADGSVRFKTCSGAITLEYPDPPRPPPVDVVDGGHIANAEPTIAAVRAKLKTCYQSALVAGHSGPTKVTWLIAIAPDGAVSSARVTRACNAPEAFERCLGEAIRPLQFEAPGGGGSKISLPITFVEKSAPKEESPVRLDGGALEECVKDANRIQRVHASALFTATGADVKIDKWSGDEALLQCAAGVIQRANATFEVELVLGG